MFGICHCVAEKCFGHWYLLYKGAKLVCTLFVTFEYFICNIKVALMEGFCRFLW